MILHQRNPSLAGLADAIADETTKLNTLLSKQHIDAPSLQPGHNTTLWSIHHGEAEDIRNKIYGLTTQLNKLLRGPSGYLHELISSNWELGALYTVLEHGILEDIPQNGTAHVSSLARNANLPENKLLSILRLLACEQIVEEAEDKNFRHTAISEEMLRDPNLRAFLGFQWVICSRR